MTDPAVSIPQPTVHQIPPKLMPFFSQLDSYLRKRDQDLENAIKRIQRLEQQVRELESASG